MEKIVEMILQAIQAGPQQLEQALGLAVQMLMAQGLTAEQAIRVVQQVVAQLVGSTGSVGMPPVDVGLRPAAGMNVAQPGYPISEGVPVQ